MSLGSSIYSTQKTKHIFDVHVRREDADFGWTPSYIKAFRPGPWVLDLVALQEQFELGKATALAEVKLGTARLERLKRDFDLKSES